jgi:hypothetical protein
MLIISCRSFCRPLCDYLLGLTQRTSKGPAGSQVDACGIHPDVRAGHYGQLILVFLFIYIVLTHNQHIGVNYTRIYRAFITYRNAPGGPAAFFNQRSEFTQMFGSTLYVMQTLVGDSVVVSDLS